MRSLHLPVFKRPFDALQALLLFTMLFGTLDLLDATLFWGLASNVPPVQILLGIASGVLGNAAFRGSLPIVILGALLEYLSFFCLLGLFHLAAIRLTALRHHPWTAGLGYGLLSYVAIHYLVLPVSAFHIVPGFYPDVFLNTVLAQTTLVGIPCALLASALKSEASVIPQEIHHPARNAFTDG